jgi:hypothetical protein
MFDPRRFTTRIQTSGATLLCVAALSSILAANAAAQSSDAWRALGSGESSPAPAASYSTPEQDWQLANQAKPHANGAASNQSTPQRSNALRQQQPASVAQEPRTFQTPATAAPIAKPQSAAVSHSNPPRQQLGGSAAVASSSAATAPTRQTNAANWQLPNGRPATNNPQPPNYRTASHEAARRANTLSPPLNGAGGGGTPNRQTSKNPPSLWQTINVAFEGEAPTQGAAESLPAPAPSKAMQRPMAHGQPDVEFNEPFQDDSFHPYGAPGCCENGSCPGTDNCNCGDNCQCGDGCEPGCGCGDSCEPGCACGQPDNCHNDEFCIGPGDDESCHTVRIRWPKWQEVMVFGGVQGFKGPYDQNHDSGNFGFHEGFNIGAKIPYAQAGYQFGYRALENQLNGNESPAIDHQAFQQFATAGVFHRSCNGLQGGVVWDNLNDERFNSLGYNQIRSELSLVSCGTHEFGVSATFGLNEHKFVEFDNSTQTLFEIDRFWEASDQYLLFYRLHGCNGGEGRFYAGANQDSEIIVGSDFLLPVGDRFSIQAGFTYLIPDAPNGSEGASKEAWNIGLGLVWHFHNQARKCHQNCYRPLFNVADNGTLIVHERSDSPQIFEVED